MGRFLYVTSALVSALLYKLRKFLSGAAPPTRAMQFMHSVSQPIIAATNQLVIYPPFLGGYLLSNFIQPVYRFSRTPVSDETPFAGFSPAISAS